MVDWNTTRYADPLELTGGQGDPLDLASINERLYNTVFFGFNNVVRYIRVYSAMCWMAWRVQEHLNGDSALSKIDARAMQKRAMDKMELALLWASGPDAELSGKTRAFAQDGSVQRLAMDEWDMSARLLSAQQYQPSLTNGLKFVKVGGVCTDRGRLLAAAFEARLGPPQAHRWLRDMNCFEATSSQIERLRPAISVLEVASAEERAAFCASFFPVDPRAMGEILDARDEQRWRGLHLVLHTIDQLGQGGDAQNEHSIRLAIAAGMTPSVRSVTRRGLERSQALWATLQLRLLQRMALETILAFVIAWVRVHNRAGRGAVDCAQEFGAAVAEGFSKVGVREVADLEALVKGAQRDHPTLFLATAARGEQATDLFYYLRELDKLRGAVWDHASGEWLRLAVTALGLCAVEAENFNQIPEHRSVLNSIDTDRMSLTALLASFRRCEQRGLDGWTRELVLHWIFSRYAEVAAHRAVGQHGKLRFDFSEGEFGLELGPPRKNPFEAAWQGDKLYTALVLLKECGMVHLRDAQWRLTAAGRRRVEEYLDL